MTRGKKPLKSDCDHEWSLEGLRYRCQLKACNALGYKRNRGGFPSRSPKPRGVLLYRCHKSREGCDKPATARVWKGLVEFFCCADHPIS